MKLLIITWKYIKITIYIIITSTTKTRYMFTKTSRCFFNKRKLSIILPTNRTYSVKRKIICKTNWSRNFSSTTINLSNTSYFFWIIYISVIYFNKRNSKSLSKSFINISVILITLSYEFITSMQDKYSKILSKNMIVRLF